MRRILLAATKSDTDSNTRSVDGANIYRLHDFLPIYSMLVHFVPRLVIPPELIWKSSRDIEMKVLEYEK